jgi:hypothetical protein
MATAVILDSGRQSPLVADFQYTFDQLISGTYIPLVKLPQGAIVTKVFLGTTTAFNSATSDSFSIGDQDTGGAANATRYAASTAAAAAGLNVQGICTGKKYAVGGTVGIVWTGVGAVPTTGAGSLQVEYIMDGRATELQP